MSLNFFLKDEEDCHFQDKFEVWSGGVYNDYFV